MNHAHVPTGPRMTPLMAKQTFAAFHGTREMTTVKGFVDAPRVGEWVNKNKIHLVQSSDVLTVPGMEGLTVFEAVK